LLTDKQTDKLWQKHNLLGGGNNWLQQTSASSSSSNSSLLFMMKQISLLSLKQIS